MNHQWPPSNGPLRNGHSEVGGDSMILLVVHAMEKTILPKAIVVIMKKQTNQ